MKSHIRKLPPDITQTSPVLARTLTGIVRHSIEGPAVRRQDLAVGDRILVTTRNSVYSMWVLDDDTFAVSGGWFDLNEISPARVRINGCTYGHSAIRQDVVAACGLFLEFGNNVRTTRIRDVRVLHQDEPTVTH